jgi:GNAT superfamily N-acetyltransferase
MTVAIEQVGAESTALIDELAGLLLDAIASGATVSFLDGLTPAGAAAWWHSVLTEARPPAIVLVAREGSRIVGTVQLRPAWAPNQPHRADVGKLLVHRTARRRGVARALMAAIERYARANGFTLLMLNTRKGDAAEPLYEALGWVRVGEVPGFALDPAGVPHDTVIFYKQI